MTSRGQHQRDRMTNLNRHSIVQVHHITQRPRPLSAHWPWKTTGRERGRDIHNINPNCFTLTTTTTTTFLLQRRYRVKLSESLSWPALYSWWCWTPTPSTTPRSSSRHHWHPSSSMLKSPHPRCVTCSVTQPRVVPVETLPSSGRIIHPSLTQG